MDQRADPLQRDSRRLLVLTAAGLILAAWQVEASWLRWFDPLIDTDRELYAAWRVSEGAVLYQDIAYLNGPFSPYWNAFWFKLFGAHLHVLLAINALASAVGLAFLGAVVARWRGNRALGLVAAAAVLVLAVLLPKGAHGGTTWLAPYSHDLLHGWVICIALVYVCARFLVAPSRSWSFGAGLLYGLAWLTKPEIIVAGSAVVAVAWFLRLRWEAGGSSHTGLFLLGASAPLVAAWALLAMATDASTALRGTLAAVVGPSNPELRHLTYYKQTAGTLDLGRSVGHILRWASFQLAVVGVPYLALRHIRSRGSNALRVLVAALLMIAGAGVVVWGSVKLEWLWFFRAHGLMVLVWLVMALRRAWGRPTADRRGSVAAGTLFLAAAASLLVKIWLAVNLIHYGFILATLAVAAWIVLLLHVLPRRFDDPVRAGWMFAYGAALIIAVVFTHTYATQDFRRHRTFHLGDTHSRFFADSVRGRMVSDVVDRLDGMAAPEDRVAVLPGGTMINFLSGRPSSVPHMIYLEPEELIFGGDRMVRDFEADPPEWIAWWDRRSETWGEFGVDYGVALARWVETKYMVEWWGSYTGGARVRLEQNRYAVRILRRSEP